MSKNEFFLETGAEGKGMMKEENEAKIFGLLAKKVIFFLRPGVWEKNEILSNFL